PFFTRKPLLETVKGFLRLVTFSDSFSKQTPGRNDGKDLLSSLDSCNIIIGQSFAFRNPFFTWIYYCIIVMLI
uniref:hypothetical protein n=1 Tax=Sphingobacterium sp. TaxID=341027 RepID=UPI0028A03595